MTAPSPGRAPLSALPPSMVADPLLPLGAFTGLPDRLVPPSLGGLPGKRHVTDFARRKKWMYVFAASDEVLVTTAIVDAGLSGSSFLTVVDRQSGALLADSSRPGAVRPLVSVNDAPARGHHSRYRTPGTDVVITNPPGDHRLHVRARLGRPIGLPVLGAPTIEVDLWFDLDALPPVLTVASGLATTPPMVSCTTKTACVPVGGRVTLRNEGTKVIHLHNGLGGFDFHHSNLPRHTVWRWAYGTGRLADGRALGINLISGFVGQEGQGAENALWFDGRLIPLDLDAAIDYVPADPWAPWSVRTADGKVDLQFTVQAVHRENLNLGLLRSRFLQPVGTFHGTVEVDGRRVEVSGIPGAVENNDILW